MKKKVLYLITKATWGGAQRYVYDLATHLPKDQFEPIVAFGETGRLRELLNEAKIETHQIPALGRDIALISDISSFFQIIRCIRNVRPDILHLNSSKAAALGALAGRLCGVPRIIFTVHGWPFKEDRNPVVRAIIYFISWFTAAISHRVIVVSKSDEDLGRRMWLVGKRIHYIPIGIAPVKTLSRKESTNLIEKNIGGREISDGKIVVGTIAELTKNKGIEYAIGAMAELKRKNRPDFLYVVIGDGELRTSLETLAKKLRLENQVFFTGFIPDAAKYIPAFNHFVLPSLKEGLPYVLLEASLVACPIIATRVGGIPDIIEDYERKKYVDVGNSKEIADAILEMESEKHLVDLEQIDRVLKRFSLEKMLKATLDLYR